MNEYKKKNNLVCQNCGTRGHHIKECTQPTISLGIILYKKTKKPDLNYLIVCRRNTIGYVEFIRGRYVTSDIEYIQKLFDVMTDYEIRIIKNKNFGFLWEHLWMDKIFKKNSEKIKRDLEKAESKFNKMKKGYMFNNSTININSFIYNKKTVYSEQEWGFPKGRRNYNESNYDAAIREFSEETNISANDIIVNKNIEFNEEYRSYDNIKYRNIYFLAEYIGNGKLTIDEFKPEQYTEISNILFLPLSGVINKFRTYDTKKKELIARVNKFLTNS
tara:strand:+ start:1826 stop:2647 length:822 start_codon:yes stop_codon:yes gene_type:complete